LKPLVSVILPVYNSGKYIHQALNSILSQSYSNLEILVFNDGSSDGSLKEIEKFSDNRIQIINSTENKGLIYNLNLGISLSKGKYIARMDADDIAIVSRIEEQVTYLEQHTDIDICGSWAQVFTKKKKLNIWKQPISKKEVDCSLLFFASFIHPTIMFRTSVIKKINFQYDNNFLHAEDYELWCRFQGKLNMVNLPRVLLLYRHHDLQVSSKYKSDQVQSTINAITLHFSKYFKEKEIFDLYVKIATQNYELNTEFLKQSKNVFDYLEKENLKFKWFDTTILNQVLSKVFFMIATHLSSNKIPTYNFYINSGYNNLTLVNKRVYLKYIFKNLILIGK
jgi:glycosyltransferase involved in cell wall biosynthesis